LVKVVSFTVPGEPMGFMDARCYWNKKVKAYHAFRDKVKLYAKQAGAAVPLRPTQEQPYIITTTTIYLRGKRGRPPDPENVHKCIVDALCYHGRMPGKKKGKHDDFWVGGEFSPPIFGEAPCVEVTIKEAVGENTSPD
jgi:hypothetical protein